MDVLLQGWMVFLFDHVYHDVYLDRVVLSTKEIRIHGQTCDKKQSLVVPSTYRWHHYHGSCFSKRNCRYRRRRLLP